MVDGLVAMAVLMVVVGSEPLLTVLATIVMYCWPGAGAILCGDLADTGTIVILVGERTGERVNLVPIASFVGVLGRADTRRVGDSKLLPVSVIVLVGVVGVPWERLNVPVSDDDPTVVSTYCMGWDAEPLGRACGCCVEGFLVIITFVTTCPVERPADAVRGLLTILDGSPCPAIDVYTIGSFLTEPNINCLEFRVSTALATWAAATLACELSKETADVGSTVTCCGMCACCEVAALISICCEVAALITGSCNASSSAWIVSKVSKSDSCGLACNGVKPEVATVSTVTLLLTPDGEVDGLACPPLWPGMGSPPAPLCSVSALPPINTQTMPSNILKYTIQCLLHTTNQSLVESSLTTTVD